MLLFGSIDVGRAMMVSNLLTNAAREGGRVSVVSTSSNADVQSTVTSVLTNMGLPANKAQTSVLVNGVAADVSTAKPADLITVTVNVSYSEVSWLPASWFLGNATVGGRVVMRRE
jgi:Flp pilus assembly protein TadG